MSRPDLPPASPVGRTGVQDGAGPPCGGGDDDFDPAVLGPPGQPGELGRLAHYRLLRRLGAGGMGVVFEAEDTALARPVALKVMKGAVAGDPAARSRFYREARAAAAVKHDHIVTIYQVGEDRGVPFIALELLQGEPLDGWLARDRRPPLPRVVAIGREVAEGLAAAHAAGLVHRDVKPANIWLEAPTGRVKLLDFGLVRAAADAAQVTSEGMVIGTPAYMSPEQACGEGVDHRTDLFSLGAVLYQMCAGEPPFRGDNVLALLAALATEDPAPVRSRNPAVPPALADLIHELLSKDQAARPPTAAAVADRLRAVEPAVATSPGWVDTVVAPAGAWRPTGPADSPRRPRAGVLLALGLVTAAAAAVAVVLYNRRDPAEPVRPPEPGGEPVAAGSPKPPPVPPAPPARPAEPAAAPEVAPPPRPLAPAPPADPERAAAAALLPRAHLKVRLPSGTTAAVRRGGQLPAGPFAVTAVELADSEYAPDYAVNVLLPAVSRFRALESVQWEPAGSLALSESDVAALAAMPAAATLTGVRGNFPLTPAALDALARLPRLAALGCNGSTTTDAVLERLPALTRLTELTLSGLTPDRVTKRGLAAVAGRPLKVLALPGLKVPVDAEVAGRFAAMSGLTELDLSGAEVRDDVLPVLSRAAGLVKLGLSQTAVTDAGLGALKGMAALRELDLIRTAVSDDGAAELAAALPRCKVWWADDRLIQPKPDAPPP